MKVFMLDGFLQAEQPLMPNCNVCGEFSGTRRSIYPDKGSHYCRHCFEWFTPVNEAAKQADAVLDSFALDSLANDAAFRAEFERRFPSLDYEFICGMDEIGKLGRDKYAENACEMRVKRGDFSRIPRIFTPEIAKHSADHFTDYINGVRHDVYGTRKHNLFAVAFNPMMEFMLAKENK